jgi:DHA2 family multidrug resistance protein
LITSSLAPRPQTEIAISAFLQQTGDQAAAHQMALQSLENLREQQASALSYFDAFLIFSALAIGLAFLVLLMKPSAAQKGQHVAAE